MGAKSHVSPNKKNHVQCAVQSSSKKMLFPKGLIGSKCTAMLNIAGSQCCCLLDTGSQVTTIPVSVYNKLLTNQPVKSLDHLLEVEGAAGQSVPYLGYVETTITFPSDFLGAEFEVQTLALIVPDVHANTSSPVLIGMNTLEVLYHKYLDSDCNTYQPKAYGYKVVLKSLELRHNQTQARKTGVVRLQSPTPVLIQAGQTKVLEGSAKMDATSTSKWAIIEHPSSILPGGLCVQSCLITLPQHSPYKVPVILKNESKQDILIPALSIIGDVCDSPTVLSQQVAAPTAKEKTVMEFNFGDSPITPEWKDRITAKLNNMPEVFAQHDLDFGCTSKVKHHIKLLDQTPFKHRARPIHPKDLEAVRNHLRDLLEAGVIRESESSFSSPIVVVRKKTGDVRLCIDYRKLNIQTIKDAYALPNLEESFAALHGSKWFSVLDLKSGYYQIEMAEEDKEKTAFVTPLGFWEWNRMPQGVTNAPSTFQRLMEKCMGDLHLREVLVFIDDLIVFSASLEEHERRLLCVLNRLKEFGLKLSPDKCKFFQTNVRYLGHVVSERGVETDPEKISTLKSWPVPRNLKELRSFLGFAGYYRRFIKDYATIAKPLNHLTRGYPPVCAKIKGKGQAGNYLDPKLSFGERWTPDCQNAFTSLIAKLTSAPVLGFANPKEPYILHTDASTTGLGAVLYQEQEGRLRVIAYASRGLSQSESRYPAHKLEFLALKWSVTEKFHDYLYGASFTVVTDSNPLTYVLTSAKLDAASHRWLAALSTYSFKLQYRAGRHNVDADALSRRTHQGAVDEDQTCQEPELVQHLTEQQCQTGDVGELSPDVVDAICNSCLLRTKSDSPHCNVALIESLSVATGAVPDSYEEDFYGFPLIPPLSREAIRAEQQSDSAIREVIHQLITGEKIPPLVREELPELPFLLREWNRLELDDGILYRKRRQEDTYVLQLVLPPNLRPAVLKALHNDMGHMGVERTLDLVRQRFFWPRMAADVDQTIKTCDRCVRRKALPERAAPLVNIRTCRPLELLCMDFLSLEPDSANTKDILVLTDHFTKFSVAIPTPNQKAKTVAKCLWEEFIVHYGIPERLHSDQGPDFESKLIKELCEVAGITKTRTTPYHPRGNPVERFNRTLLNMLGTLEAKQKSKWREYMKPLVHAYNCTRNEVTGFTPYELLFGRSPRLPVDLAFGLPVRDPPSVSHSEYVKNLRSRLEESYKLASQNSLKSNEKNKRRFDQRVIPCSLEVGDRVLVRNVRLRGKHKLEDKWEHDVYVVTKRAGNLPVYTIKPETKDGPSRTLHRDLLLPCGFLPSSPVQFSNAETSPVRPKTRSQSKLQSDSVDLPEEDAESVLSEGSVPSPVRFRVPEPSGQPQLAPGSLDCCIFPSTAVVSSADPQLKSTTMVPSSMGAKGANLPEVAEPVLMPEGDPSNLASNESEQPVEVPVEEDLPTDVSITLPDVGLSLESEVGDAVQSESSPEVANPNTTIGPRSPMGENLTPRRSTRQRRQPSRLKYSVLGNPLISVIQTLLQNVSNA
uniref:Gypsy retrotransposon integrase-like protein 1 n=1 Tax=Oryzias latipes TaxID=8090 RepID=A0A3P9ITK5_ORYLA